MTKQEQNEEMVNISTKEEIEARNKRDKEKDELRQALLHYATAEASGGIKSLIDCEGCAFYLYENLGYRKLPEDSVVLSREEIGELKYQSEEDVSKAYDLGSKETAEKIFKMLISKLESNQFLSGKRIIMEVDVENLAKQFDVEIEG